MVMADYVIAPSLSFHPGSRYENPTELKAEDVIAWRSGDVLIKHTMLKADHFPGCQNMKLRPLLEGAPNFRQIEGLPVYGVAVPTVNGFRNVLEALGAGKGRRKVYWQNMREEPLVYINGKPYVVREADQPFCNLEYTGIDRSRVEDMEKRLKQDILAESQLFNNQILVAHESDDMQVLDHWEPVTESDVQTPNEVYAELIADGYDIDYLRVPITDEKAPKDRDFELLIHRIWSVPEGAAIIFNCQMGRGRTTTGTIIASVLLLRKMGAYPVANPSQIPENIPAWFKRAMEDPRAFALDPGSDKLKKGMYGVIRSLLRVLERGIEGKAILDAVIDAASGMQNLREAMAGYRTRYMAEQRESRRNAILVIALEYLERYYMLIAFTAYTVHDKFNPLDPDHLPFTRWMQQRPEMRSVLQRMLRRNSLAAMELFTPAVVDNQQEAGEVKMQEAEGDEDNDEAGAVVAARTGAVLGPNTVLKEDNYAAMRSSRVHQVLHGAANFRGVPGLPVFGVAMPTVEGIMAVLRHVHSGPRPDGKPSQVKAIWFNMREEPVVYINGRPFVLREEVRPLKNMQEYAGIDAKRLEQMELRLKNDVLAEARKYGGRVLVMQESDSTESNGGVLEDAWEPVEVSDTTSVQTPTEMYAWLQRRGFGVVYTRVPVTDGTSPTSHNFDVIREQIMSAKLGVPIVFNCQLGIGRSTTGMVIASLTVLHMQRQQGQMLQDCSSLNPADIDIEQLHAELTGHSPRRVSSDGGDTPRPEDEDCALNLWEMTPEELAEQRNLAAGAYFAVRRVCRLLEEGETAKHMVDFIIDACGELCNLRMAIMRYRKPRDGYKFLRPEIQQRHSAFKRGIAYLERYCMLITYWYYLEHVMGSLHKSYEGWLNGRNDLQSAFSTMHANPAAALAPLPVQLLPGSVSDNMDVTSDEVKQVLNARRGRMLTKRSILKGYQSQDLYSVLQGVPNARGVEGLPVFSVGNLTVNELRCLLELRGAGPSGLSHVVITDVREELVVYVNGTPYMRRELEMPVAALHHAGVHSYQLQDMEKLLRDDTEEEALRCGGRVLVHRELNPTVDRPPVTMDDDNCPCTPPPPPPPELEVPANGTSGGGVLMSNGSVGSEGIDGCISPDGPPTGASGEGKDIEDVTRRVDVRPDARVAPTWESVEVVDSKVVNNGIMTAQQVIAMLQAEGFHLGYRRVPLSRERTPVVQDLERLRLQMAAQADEPSRSVVHLVLNRTATGSSSRFVVAALCTYYVRNNPAIRSAAAMQQQKRMRRTGSDLGEYRGIMSLCRLLPQGFEMKLSVDSAIDMCRQVGHLRYDIRKCKHFMDNAPSPVLGEGGARVSDLTAVRQLGVHYLKRYFLLVCFRAYLEQHDANSATCSFRDWMDERKELHHMCTNLQLEA